MKTLRFIYSFYSRWLLEVELERAGWAFWAIREYPDGSTKHVYRYLN